MNHLKDYALIILTAFVAVFCYRSCNGIKDTQILVKEIHDTVYQQKTFTKYKKGDSIPYVIVRTDSVQKYVHDTVYVLYDYSQVKAYSDTIKDNSNIFVINDTISQNSIKSRSFTAKITEKTIYVKQFYAEKAKYSLFWGIRGDFSQDNGLEVLSPGLMLNAKNKALIGLNVDLGKNGGLGYSGSLYFKIGKK